MKVLVGQFVTESNAHIPLKNEISNYVVAFGDDCIRRTHVGEVFAAAGIEVIPSVFADAAASGVIKPDTFAYIESCFLRAVREHLDEIDGIYLMLHGASEVEGLGSGEHHILWEIRKIVGPYLPIAVCCDPHGNLCKDYVEDIQILRSYRESPHTDSIATMQKVAGMLCDLLKDRQNIHAAYHKLPLILGGEQSVSTDEPVKSLNAYMDELERDPRIRSISWHVGYLRHDSPVAGCAIVAVPQTEADQAYAQQVADTVADYIWQRRKEFHYTGLTMDPETALQKALAFADKPVFITDSGDNVTSGATGWNTYILRQVLAVSDLQKKVLFANITDPATYQQLAPLEVGARAHIRLGVDRDEMSRSVDLDVTVRAKGKLQGFLFRREGSYGDAVAVSVDGTPITVVVANTKQAMVEIHQFEGVGVSPADYDLVVVKQGYIFPELKEMGKLCIMSLTDGATPQDTRLIPFKKILRPMYPLDEI